MIRVSNLNKKIDGQVILDDVSVEVADGEIVAIVGESGAGKSVFLQHLIGLIKPDKGKIEIDGINIVELSERELLKIRKNIGYLFQQGALYDSMTVYENLAFPLEEHTDLSEKQIKEKVKKILQRVELNGIEEKYPVQLSGGMKKRAALARSVILGTKILFCDEPTSGLDPMRSRDISDLIKDIAKEFKCTTIITSHDIPNAFRISDKIVIIHEGRIVATGTKKQLEDSESQFVKQFIS